MRRLAPTSVLPCAQGAALALKTVRAQEAAANEAEAQADAAEAEAVRDDQQEQPADET